MKRYINRGIVSFMVDMFLSQGILISQDFLCNWKRTPAEPTFVAYTSPPHLPPKTTIAMTSNRNKQCLREDGWKERTGSNLELAPYACHFCACVYVCVCARERWCTNTLWHLLFRPYNEQKRSASTQPVFWHYLIYARHWSPQPSFIKGWVGLDISVSDVIACESQASFCHA